MLITHDLYLVTPYDPTNTKNGFTVTRQDGTVVGHTTTHESAMAVARLMATSTYGEPFNSVQWDPNFVWDPFEPDLGPVFKSQDQAK